MQKFLILNIEGNVLDRFAQVKILPDGPEIQAGWTDNEWSDKWITNKQGDVIVGELSITFINNYEVVNSDTSNLGFIYLFPNTLNPALKEITFKIINTKNDVTSVSLPPIQCPIIVDEGYDDGMKKGDIIKTSGEFKINDVEPYATREEIEKDPRLLNPTYDKISGKYIKEASQSKDEPWTLEKTEE